MKTRLSESQKLNSNLQEQLEKATKARSEERNGLNQLNEQQKQEIISLRQELKKVNNVCDNLRDATKKADAEITSYKKEHDIEFNTMTKALADSRKINESLKERLKEKTEHKESRTSCDDRATSPRSVKVDQLQNELAAKTRIIESLNKKLQKHGEGRANQTSFTSPEDSSPEGRAPKTASIRQLQKDLDERQEIIDALTEELNKNNNRNLQPSSLLDHNKVNTRLSSSPRTSKELEKELAESQRIIQTLREKLEIRKDDKERQTSFDKGSFKSGDVVDGTSPDERRSSRLQSELAVYKKNEELRKAVSQNITLADLNRQLREDLTSSEQRGGVLEKELQNYEKKVKDTNSEVSRLVDELARTRTLNSDYVSQSKTLRRQQEQAKSMNEKLSAEVQQLFASLGSVGKENDR